MREAEMPAASISSSGVPEPGRLLTARCRHAELDMHPLDARDRRTVLRERQGLGLGNITKCCTEVCPAGIKITDNAIIPMKERSADQRYDPLGRVLRAWRRREGRTPAG
jgi:succinate dehydrogenase / fumarate reductase iron-sulfur subunit